MPHQCRKSIPQAQWPKEIITLFEKKFSQRAEWHRKRLRLMLGRWLLDADVDELPPDLVTPPIVKRRTSCLDAANTAAMKQAVFEIFGELTTFAPVERQQEEDDRDRLARIIEWNLHRLPDDWRVRAAPMLHLSSDALSDGAIVEARAVTSIETMLLTSVRFFAFCRESDMSLDVVPETFRLWVRQRQAQHVNGNFSIHTMIIESQSLLTFGRDIFPERNWRWLEKFHAQIKKRARDHPTRANLRFVALEELRIAAQQAMTVACKAHKRSSGYREKLRAHTLARTALSILILINSPIRVGSLAALDLGQHFDPGLTRLYLSPLETKDRRRDERYIPQELKEAIKTYLDLHRPLIAPAGETRLFVGRGGAPCSADRLSTCIGDLTVDLFGCRVSAHMIRNVIAAFIVSEAPDEAGLVAETLNHRRGSSSTETYRGNANQIVASRRLHEAAERKKDALGLGKPCPRRRKRGRR